MPGPRLCKAPLPLTEQGLGLPVRGAVSRITEGSGSQVPNNQPGRASGLSMLYVGAAGMLSTNLSGETWTGYRTFEGGL